MARIQQLENGRKIIIDEWGEDDIQSVADTNFEMDLTPAQISRVMDIIVEGYDANIGINWDVIDSAIDIMLVDEALK